jgi:hypothetical protein
MNNLLILMVAGLKGIMISAAPGTADTPRAHYTNMASQGSFTWIRRLSQTRPLTGLP